MKWFLTRVWKKVFSRLSDWTLKSSGRLLFAAVPDDKKGEAIVLLSSICDETISHEIIDLRYKLLNMGIPSLWTPKEIIPIDEIPVLPTGKLDLKACQARVNEFMEAQKKA